MRYAVIAAAGNARRFNAGEADERMKCIYYEDDRKKTLLYSILKKCIGCDFVVIVAGFQKERLADYINCFESDFDFKIAIIENLFFEKYGTGYSLKKGLDYCLRDKRCSEILFIEGDLCFDEETFQTMINEPQNCITICNEPIWSKKAVALYITEENRFRYLYNTDHGLFSIKEPFAAIFNSGQVWKMADRKVIESIVENMCKEDWEGTNLVFLEKYFNQIPREQIKIIKFKNWMNCNTREDYRESITKL